MFTVGPDGKQVQRKRADDKPAKAAALATTTLSWTRLKTTTTIKNVPVSTIVTTECDNPTFRKQIYRTYTVKPWRATTVYKIGETCTARGDANPKPTPRAAAGEPVDAGEMKREEDCGYTNSAGQTACYTPRPTKAGVYTETKWIVEHIDVPVTEEHLETVVSTVCVLPAATVTEWAGP
jgi:hypothetical protein